MKCEMYFGKATLTSDHPSEFDEETPDWFHCKRKKENGLFPVLQAKNAWQELLNVFMFCNNITLFCETWCHLPKWRIDCFQTKSIQRLKWRRFASGRPPRLSQRPARSKTTSTTINGSFGASCLGFSCSAHVDRLLLLLLFFWYINFCHFFILCK